MSNVSKHNLYNEYNCWSKGKKTTTVMLNRGQWHHAKACLRKAVLWEPKLDSSDK